MLTAEHPVVAADTGDSGRARQTSAQRRTATARAPWTTVALLVALAAIARALVSSFVPLLPDETYYWDWSRHLQAGYFDHPPGIALLIAAGTAVFGNTTLGVRFGPAVAAVVLHVALVTLAARLGGPRAAVRAAVLGAVLPFSLLGLTLATPDAALLAMATVALVCLERALGSPLRSRQSLGWWTLTGIALGSAFVSKFTAVLLPFALVIACLVYRPLRARFREPGPWVASAVALLVFAPVILWNAGSSWISFRFQLAHGFGASARGTPVGRELEMIGGQLGLATPVLGVLMCLAVIAAARSEWRLRHAASPTSQSGIRFALAVVSVTPFVFFAISAWQRPIEPNWPALAYTASVAVLASARAGWANGRWWKGGVGFAVVLVLAAMVQTWKPVAPVAPNKDPIARAHGWAALANAVHRARNDPFLAGTGTRWVAAERYQDASELAFNLPDQPTVFSLNLAGRANQYDLWPGPRENVRPGDALVAAFDATPGGDSLARVVGSWFAQLQPGETVRLRRGAGVVATRRLWLYRGARAIPVRVARLP